MRTSLAIALVALVLVLALSTFYIVRSRPIAPVPTESESTTTPYTVPPLTQAYANKTYGFSLTMPADFSATESEDPTSGADTIVLQDQSGDGIQIVITSLGQSTPQGYTLTAARIHQDLPSIEIDDAQPVDIGTTSPAYVGLAFLSDNPAFGGASREVWFVFRGNLYQISTYARLDPLLQAIFATWQFN